MNWRRPAFRHIFFLFAFMPALCPLALADTKTIVAEAFYSMGDGETPSSAEALVLQKAKQRALEEAGIYVESYSHVRQLDLGADEIKTIAGGVMKTEIVEQSRAMEGHGLRFYVKIKSLITTDDIDTLAGQQQLGVLAQENKRLQGHLLRLTSDLEALKQRITQPQTDSERDADLEKIRDIEKQFRHVWSTETALYRRLVWGPELSAQVDKAFREEHQRKEAERERLAHQQETLERFLTELKHHGHALTVSPPETQVSLERPDTVGLKFTVTATASDEARSALHALHEAYRGDLPKRAAWRIEDVLDQLELAVTVVLNDGRQYVGTQPRVHNFHSPRHHDILHLAQEAPTAVAITVPIPTVEVADVASVEGTIRVSEHPLYARERTVKGDARLDLSSIPREAKPYAGQVFQRIRSFWSTPPLAVAEPSAEHSYAAAVGFRVNRNGTITQVRITESSGNKQYDLAAKRAVALASPLPAFPSDVTVPHIDTAIEFRVVD